MFKWVNSSWQKILGIPEDTAWIFTVFTLLLLSIFIPIRVGQGLYDSNKEDECIVQSLGDIAIAPFYAIGCQLGKKRFKIRLN